MPSQGQLATHTTVMQRYYFLQNHMPNEACRGLHHMYSENEETISRGGTRSGCPAISDT